MSITVPSGSSMYPCSNVPTGVSAGGTSCRFISEPEVTGALTRVDDWELIELTLRLLETLTCLAPLGGTTIPALPNCC